MAELNQMPVEDGSNSLSTEFEKLQVLAEAYPRNDQPSENGLGPAESLSLTVVQGSEGSAALGVLHSLEETRNPHEDLGEASGCLDDCKGCSNRKPSSDSFPVNLNQNPPAVVSGEYLCIVDGVIVIEPISDESDPQSQLTEVSSEVNKEVVSEEDIIQLSSLPWDILEEVHPTMELMCTQSKQENLSCSPQQEEREKLEYLCNYCDYVSTNLSESKRHVYKHLFMCDECGYLACTRSTILSHICHCHRDLAEKVMPCYHLRKDGLVEFETADEFLHED